MKRFLLFAILVLTLSSEASTLTPDLDYTAPEGVTGEPVIRTYREVGRIISIGNSGVRRNNCKDHLNSPENPLVRWPIVVQYGNFQIDTCYYAKRPNVIPPEIGGRFEIIIKSYIFPGIQLD